MLGGLRKSKKKYRVKPTLEPLSYRVHYFYEHREEEEKCIFVFKKNVMKRLTLF
jgi:hypothetical protein